MKLTEDQILKKLEDYKNAITSLIDKNNKLENEIAFFKADMDESNDLLVERLDEINRIQSQFDNFKEKTAKTIKHLVEDVIEKQEIKLKENEDELKDVKQRLRKNVQTIKPVEPEHLKKEDNNVIQTRKIQFGQDKDIIEHYKFGDARKSFGDAFKKFVKECCPEQPGKFIVEPRICSLKLNISSKIEQAYIDHLEAIELDKKPTIEEIGGSYYTNFTVDKIIESVF